MIGRHWLVTDGVRRLDAPADPVRVELRTAIATKVPLIARARRSRRAAVGFGASG